MANFTYNDIVRAKDPLTARLKGPACIVGIFEHRPGPYFDKFPAGIVYTVEFEDGTSDEVHEDDLVEHSADLGMTGTDARAK